MQKNHPQQKILIIDDTPANITMLNEMLQDEYQIFFATSGAEGLKVAAALVPPYAPAPPAQYSAGASQ